MPQDKIVVVGARENNLKNVTVEIPRDKLVVITGLSGSGKSSLAFDTIYAEGQRRYVESLSAYARQFLGQMDKPDVDHIDGLSPAVAIDQKSASRNPRSTVGTVTEIYDYLRILFARVGVPHCPNCGTPIERQSTDQIVDAAKQLPEGTRLQILAPIIRGRKGEYKRELQEINKAGYVRVRVDGRMYEVTDDIPMDRYKQHTIEVVVDRLVVKEGIDRRLADSIEAALKMGKGLATLSYEDQGVGGKGVRGKDQGPGNREQDRLDEGQPGARASSRASGDGEPVDDGVREGERTREPESEQAALEDVSPRPQTPADYTQLIAERQGDGSLAAVAEPRQPDADAYAPRPASRVPRSESASDAKPSTPESQPSGWIDQLFSESYSCVTCGFNMPELEPRQFSFNSPYGACPECTGLGTKTEFDPQLICPDPRKQLRDGAIAPFVYKSGETKDWWPDALDAVGKRMGFDASLPVEKLTPEQMDAVWNGLSGTITVNMKYGRRQRSFDTKWDGVLAYLRKRYDQTESEWVKRDLEQYMSTKPCPVCEGKRLKPETLAVKITGRHIADITAMPVEHCLDFFRGLTKQLNERQLTIAARVIKEILERLKFLSDVGLNYLTLDRNARTLAGGEAQRIRLATQIGSGLMGCLYILDEPSIGLHQRDNRKLIETLQRLRDLGNTVLVVEHDEETMRSADWLIELGPGAGEHGGKVVAQGTVEQFLASDCVTAEYLTGRREIPVPEKRREPKSPVPIR